MDISSIIEKIRQETTKPIEWGLVLGSGIDVSSLINNKIEFSYNQLGMPSNKVKGHSGKFIIGDINGVTVILASRYHYYECGDMSAVRLPYEIMNALGVKNVILQTSSGAIDKKLKAGEICLIKDHINLAGTNPLINYEPLKFVNMSNNYDVKLRDLIRKNNKISEVVHIQMSGPNYETKSEIAMARLLGGQTVSMSMAFDNIIARYFDMKVLAFAVVTNELSDDASKTLSHIEVLECAKKANKEMLSLLSDLFN